MALPFDPHPTLPELERRFANLRAEAQRRQAELEEKARWSWLFQPRVPAGQPGGGQWTSTGGVVTSMRGATPAQQARLQQSAEQANAIIARVRQIDPNWRPTPGLFQTTEGAIAHNSAIAKEAARRLGDLLGVPYGLGPFASRSVPSSGPHVRAGERRAVNTFGREDGCHTCGTRAPGSRSGGFYCDHQQPTALNPPGRVQRLFPHCARCSAQQGGFVSYLLRWE